MQPDGKSNTASDEDAAMLAEWRRVELPKILEGNCGWRPETKAKIDTAFSAYTGLEGLRGAFYLGVESCNCEGMIPNEYALDDPKRRAFSAGFNFGATLWGDPIGD